MSPKSIYVRNFIALRLGCWGIGAPLCTSAGGERRMRLRVRVVQVGHAYNDNDGTLQARYYWSAILHYRNSTSDRQPFAVTYESGIDAVPNFDAHLAVYGVNKRIEIRYDSPYVKRLPIIVRVYEQTAEGDFQSREIMSSYEDAYTAELTEMYNYFMKGQPIKTTLEDAMQDVKLYDLIYQSRDSQIEKQPNGSIHGAH